MHLRSHLHRGFAQGPQQCVLLMGVVGDTMNAAVSSLLIIVEVVCGEMVCEQMSFMRQIETKNWVIILITETRRSVYFIIWVETTNHFDPLEDKHFATTTLFKDSDQTLSLLKRFISKKGTC